MTSILKQTPLCQAHTALQARLVEFAGWEMPLQYKGILEEHRAVRSSAGAFDVSHMGRLEVTGRDAGALLNKTLTASIADLPLGRARYSLLCRDDGGILDDLVAYHLEPERFFVVCNAASRIKVVSWLSQWAKGYRDAALKDITEETAMIAWQGPQVAQAMDNLYRSVPSKLKTFGCLEMRFPFGNMVISRTGYTGEDGFELIMPGEQAPPLWDAILNSATVPCGLGARDTLRLEAALPLYGNDMDESVNPLEAGLDRFVALDKRDFVGKSALLTVKQNGLTRRLVGFEMVDKGIPRHGYPIVVNDKPVGWVTSGGYSPTLDKGVGLGYVPTGFSAIATFLHIDVRGRLLQAKVVKIPFYRRGAKAATSGP